jgi:hypothetical protein
MKPQRKVLIEQRVSKSVWLDTRQGVTYKVCDLADYSDHILCNMHTNCDEPDPTSYRND